MGFLPVCAIPGKRGVIASISVRYGLGGLQIPRLPPDFLSSLIFSVNLMRLSSKKAAYVVVFESSVVGNPEFARDDKV
jgi:hypothetical protein